MRSYSGRLFAVTRRLFRAEEDAKDALQDAFLSAFRALHTFEEGSLLSTWLHRIAVRIGKVALTPSEGVVPAEVPEDLIEAILASRSRAV